MRKEGGHTQHHVDASSSVLPDLGLLVYLSYAEMTGKRTSRHGSLSHSRDYECSDIAVPKVEREVNRNCGSWFVYV